MVKFIFLPVVIIDEDTPYGVPWRVVGHTSSLYSPLENCFHRKQSVVKVYYTSRPQDQVTYNFNLINWNAYKSPSQENIIYLTDSISTYNLLLKTKEENANVHLLSVDATQIIVFRAKTQKGVEQNLKCMAGIIIDKSPDMFNYHIQGIFITVKPRLRSDVNDDYVVCTIDSDSSLQQEILSSQK